MEDDVVERIASFLPRKEAHKLAILSTRFRNSWKFCRDFSFDRDFAKNLSKDEFKSLVNKIFNEHLNSKADKFKLCFDATGETALVSQWIKNAIRLGINEFELDFTPSGKIFMLSYDMIDVESIKTIKLVKCELYLPFASNGLRHLRDLTIERVKARPVTIQAVFINCLALRSLQLINCSSVSSLKIPSGGPKGFKKLVVKDCWDVHSIAINAPKLCTLHYHGKICEFKFQSDFPELNDVILDIAHPRGFQMLPHRKDMMISLTFIRSLTVSSAFLEGLSARFEDNEYREMEFCLWNLKEFHLVVAKESFINPYDIVIFLKKCPRIERVFIDLGDNAFGNSLYWDFHGRKLFSECRALFPFLNIVKVKGFTFKELPVTMGKFFLKNAIYLQSLIIVKAKNYIFPQLFTPDWLKWEIPSRAKIEIYEYLNDKSVIIPQHLKI
ncbi:hypothetical protein BUALT_Bualt03G0064500 [Buddleja alternifolia]|uniref:At1g61320/AtMIF1 LRR domain-containing protein n=1 Tax=Buddleja alternifolia TaxID=168488 RepID=A0AAV6XVW8_9LAMI|nr:hypothetical protein BUALT_Bualt03G0064500 [Buddleja alternifolia]